MTTWYRTHYKTHQAGANINKKTRDAIFARDNYRCVYCGYYANQIDHVIPVAQKGHTSPNNLVACCNKCNTKKAHHLRDPKWLVTAIFHLMSVGEDTRWIDEYTKKSV